MTREEYGQAYQAGFRLTVHFLISRGIVGDAAGEAAQAAWARGWERIGQLRSSNLVVTWVNSIALNIYRSYLRRPVFETLHDVSISFQMDFTALDLQRILSLCNSDERTLLQQQYLEELKFPKSRTSKGVRRWLPESGS